MGAPQFGYAQQIGNSMKQVGGLLGQYKQSQDGEKKDAMAEALQNAQAEREQKRLEMDQAYLDEKRGHRDQQDIRTLENSNFDKTSKGWEPKKAKTKSWNPLGFLFGNDEDEEEEGEGEEK